MCGFYGVVAKDFDYTKNELKDISTSINHRGPDSHNSIKEHLGKNYIYFDHNRLSIIDLSDNGTQPFYSEDKNFILVFNGEIYNFKEIRKILEKKNIRFTTNTDTEVLLNAWIEWGEDCLSKLRGMFSFSILDKSKQKIFLIKDNFGMKPLYFFKDENKFFFASEIICILKLLKKKISINYKKTYDYLIYGDHDNSSDTFFTGIFQLRPGEILTMDLKKNSIKRLKWWHPQTNLVKNISFEDAKLKVRENFLESVQKHMISDVEIGIALSGGVDSSAIACAVKYLNPKKKINLFSFITETKEEDETHWIEVVEKHLNEKSIKISQSKIELSSMIDEIIEFQGEPFGDTTIIAEYLIFMKAKQENIKVLLMGHGGDEIFAGYDGFPGIIIKTYVSNLQFLKLLKFCYYWIKRNKSSLFILIKKVGNEFFTGKFKTFLLYFAGVKQKPNWINKDFFKKKNIIFGVNKKKHHVKNNRNLANKQLDNIFYNNLPAMLRYADRSSMKNSIECRLPFLNSDLFIHSLTLPENFLVTNKGITKYIFKESMKDIVPKEILNRKDKIGYFNNDNDFIQRVLKNTELNSDLDLFDLPNLNKFLNNNNSHNNLQKWRIINFIRWKNIFSKFIAS